MPLKLVPPGTRKGNKVWYILGSVDGRQIEVSTKTTDERVARAKLAALIREAKAGAREPVRSDTFAHAAELYKAYRNPRQADLKRIDRIVGGIGHKKLAELRPVDLITLANQLLPDAVAATKNREVLVPAVAIMHYASQNGMCAWLRVSLFRQPRPRARAVSRETASCLIDAAPLGQKRLFIIWLFCQGSRISDALRVDWTDLDLERRVVKMHVHKTDSHMTFPLHDDVLGLLLTVPEEERVGRLFPWGDKSNVYRWLRPLVRRLGVTFTPHMARHSVGTWMSESGASLRAIMDALGHLDVKSSLRYQSGNIELVRREMGRAISVLPGSISQTSPASRVVK